MNTFTHQPILRTNTDLHTLVGAGRGLQARAMRKSFGLLTEALLRPVTRTRVLTEALRPVTKARPHLQG